MIPYGRQDITEEDIESVVAVLRSDYITQGELVPEFERQLSAYAGANHAVVANSATSCLHMACLALGLGQGDTLWCPAITFVASSNCALYCGADVDFVDVDPRTANIDINCLEDKLKHANAGNNLPKILVVVHMAGHPCDMKKIRTLTGRYGVKIVEDASHGIGARYLDHPVGNCEFSDITIFSFHPVKIITTAEGGAALTNDPALAQELTLYRGHGITRDHNLMRGPTHGPWYYQQIRLGFNYRMTELQAALGISQLSRIDRYIEQRNKIAQVYDTALEHLPVYPVRPLTGSLSAYHLYLVLLHKDTTESLHSLIFEKMREQGVGVNIHYIPVPLQPYYSDMGFLGNDYPGAMEYYHRTISLPLYPLLSSQKQDEVVDALTNALMVSQSAY